MDNSLKELCSIREWSPLDLNNRIPSNISRGFFSKDVKFTCVDAIEDEFLAIGSDVGIVFWYSRQTGETQKLRAEVASRITCVKIVDSVEFMVAAGSANGQVSVFQIQKALPPDLDLYLRSKPIERYTIRDLHRTPISCCEWSKNGMKLYSGDREGKVVLTEFDYQTHLSKSLEILCEAYEIVQLNVYQSYLLVSTLYRAIICQRNITSGEWHITQIGKKDRKQLIDCGGIFLKNKNNTKNPKLITGRPGLRFWIADTEGNVEKTLLFREAVAKSPTWEIPILNPKIATNRSLSKFPKNNDKDKDNENENTQSVGTNFRNFFLYTGQDTLVVTHDEENLYILNLDRLRVECVAKNFRKILDFCVCGKEIFVLEGERSLVRLAPLPEKPNKTAQIIFNPSMPPMPPPILGAAAIGLFESPVEYEPEEQSIVNAEECFELPPIETLNLNIPIELAVESPRAEQNRRFQIFNQISEQKFEESILHRSGLLLNGGRKKRKSKSIERQHQNQATSSGIVEIGHVANANTNENENEKKPTTLQTTHATLMDASFCKTNQEEKHNETELIKKIKNEEDFTLPSIQHISPIAAEELECARALANLSSPLNLDLTGNATIQQQQSSIKSPILKFEYPKRISPHLDAEVQTTPRKKIYYIQQEQESICGDYSDGQPVDDICTTLRATNLIEDTEIDVENVEQQQREANNKQLPSLPLQFIAASPDLSEVNSFMPDFRRIRDPLQKKSPPPSGDSGTSSSEWEFLDN